MGKTTISWTERTWNPVRGCSRVSEGCRNCYAERMAARRLPEMRFSDGSPLAVMTPSGPRWTGRLELIPHMLELPMRRRKPTAWFVNSMSDVFHESLAAEEIDRIFAVMAQCPQHTFQILTKRAERMREWARGGGCPLGNVWLGVSVEDRQNLGRIEELRGTPAATRFLSLEPLLEDLGCVELGGIDFAIIGGESGPGARPCDVAWIRSLIRQCRAAGVACFVKQLGAVAVDSEGTCAVTPSVSRRRVPGESVRLALDDAKGGDPGEWPEDVRVRQLPDKILKARRQG